jgi:hypothetical protein
LRTFEIADDICNTWFGEDDMKDKASYYLVGDEALLAKLAELGVTLEMLGRGSQTDYPL